MTEIPLGTILTILSIVAVGGGIILAIVRLIFNLGRRREVIDITLKEVTKGLERNTRATNGTTKAVRTVARELKNHVREHEKMGAQT